MLRGHFRSLAVYSLIPMLVASPVMAGTPGAASRRAAERAASQKSSTQQNQAATASGAVQNAFGTRTGDQGSAVQQVAGNAVGKQLSSPSRSSGRRLALLPSLFGSNSQSNNARRQTPAATQQTRPSARGSSPQANGILGNLFGDSSSSSPSTARPGAGNSNSAPKVDWQGIPYHQARSTNTSGATRTPIRDPRPGETRISGNSSLANQTTPPRLAARPNSPTESASGSTTSLPKPPALAPAPSSRRTVSKTVVVRPAPRKEASVLSPLSSSRRSGRRDVPTLDASEIAAAQSAPIDEDELVPHVARRSIKPAPAKTEVASKTDPKPATRSTPKSDSSPQVVRLTDQPENSSGRRTTSISPAAKPMPKSTPAADVATVKPSPKPTPLPAAAAPETIAKATPLPATPLPATPQATPISADEATPNLPTATPDAPKVDRFGPAKVATAPAISTPNVEPTGPQFVPPRLPLPAAPNFSTGAPVGLRVGPPANAFQPRSVTPTQSSPQPQFAGQPAPSATPYSTARQIPQAIGSGIANPPALTSPSMTAASTPPASERTATTLGYPRTTPSQTAPFAGGPSPRIAAAPTPVAPQPLPGSPMPTENVDSTRRNGGHPIAMDSRTAFSPAPFTSAAAAPVQAATQANESQTAGINAGKTLAPGQTAVASELPGIRVVTHGPSSVTIRQNHEFEIRVENRGSIDASGVMVRTVVPDWAEIKGQSSSRGEIENQAADESGRLVWTIDSLPAGTTEKLFVRLQAVRSGVHDLDVDWTLLPQKSVAKIEVREPKLNLIIEGPDQVVYGQSQTYKVRVLNPGDGVAPNVMFTLSPNSSTPQTQRIGDIPRGKEAQFEVELTAQDLGDLKIHGLASGGIGLKAHAEKTIKVLSAELEAVLAGPEVKYQNTDAIYHLQVTNTGDATCKNAKASLALPPGVRYVSGLDVAKLRGTKLTWEIDSLTPGATREYEFTCQMVSPGRQAFEFEAEGSAAGRTNVALDTRVESIADLVMTIKDPTAPAPVGSEVVYEILIKNRGSRQALNIRAIAQFSNGIEPRRIEGHSGQVLTGQVILNPIDAIRPGEEVRIRIVAEAETAGHHRFRTEIRSGETVLVAEEATQYLSKQTNRVSRRSSSSSKLR